MPYTFGMLNNKGVQELPKYIIITHPVDEKIFHCYFKGLNVFFLLSKTNSYHPHLFYFQSFKSNVN